MLGHCSWCGFRPYKPTSGGLTGYKMPGVGTVIGDEYYNEDYGGRCLQCQKIKYAYGHHQQRHILKVT